MVETLPATVAICIILAYCIEGIVEYFVAWLVGLLKWPKEILMYVSLALGLVVAFGFGLNIITALAEQVGYTLNGWWWLGTALTGILLARGSNWLHDLWSRFFGSKPTE